METQTKNLFIVDDNRVWTSALKQYLKQQLGTRVNITSFNDGESCIRNLNSNPDVILLDYILNPLPNSKNGIDYLKEIKQLSPASDVFIVSSTDNFSLLVNAVFSGAKKYIVKGKKPWVFVFDKIHTSVRKAIGRIREYSFQDYLILYLTTFISIGVAVMLALILTG